MEEEIDLGRYLKVIYKWRRLILKVAGGITLLSILICLFLPKSYLARATLMPVGGGGGKGLALAAAQLGLGGLLGNAGGGSSNMAQLLAVLRSQTLAERVIRKYDLMKVLYPKLWDEKNQKWKRDPNRLPPMLAAVENLLSVVSFKEDLKSQLITVESEFRDPVLAAGIANGYVEQLAGYLSQNALTSAKRNRIFIEGQLERNKADLLESGKVLNDFYASKGISNVEPKLDVDLKSDIPSEFLADPTDPVQNPPAAFSPPSDDSPGPSGLPALPSAFAGEQKEIGSLQKKVNEVETRIQKAKVVKDVPQQVYLQYLTLRRELLGQVNVLLNQQYEMAKIHEAEEDLTFQVIDWARVPIEKFKPKRRQIVIMTFIFSLFFSTPLVFLKEHLEKTSSKA